MLQWKGWVPKIRLRRKDKVLLPRPAELQFQSVVRFPNPLNSMVSLWPLVLTVVYGEPPFLSLFSTLSLTRFVLFEDLSRTRGVLLFVFFVGKRLRTLNVNSTIYTKSVKVVIQTPGNQNRHNPRTFGYRVPQLRCYFFVLHRE